jgi:hypothetical protein
LLVQAATASRTAARRDRGEDTTMRNDLLRRLSPLAAAILLATACNAESEPSYDDTTVDEDDPAGKEDGVVRPVGTFRNDVAAAGEPALLVLKTDKTFHLETMIYCVRFPCNPLAADGRYKYTISHGIRYIRLYDADNRPVDRFAYRFDGTNLSLRHVYTETWFDMAPAAPAWCAEVDDCLEQDLISPMCLGEWTCGSSACAFRCGMPEPMGNACEDAGGICTGLRPDACGDGSVAASAESYPCGPEGLLGVRCCMPRSACSPECHAVGTRSEGWYDGCTGELVCWANCAGSEAVCDAIGSRSEGWYSSGGSDTGCMAGALIRWDQCAS